MYDCVNMYKVHKRVKASDGDTLYPPYPLKTITTTFLLMKSYVNSNVTSVNVVNLQAATATKLRSHVGQ